MKIATVIIFLTVQLLFAGVPQGTLVGGNVVPTDSSDIFPTHNERWGLGGWRSVANTIERDTISTLRRKVGMAVYCIYDSSYWQLRGGIDNANWKKLSIGMADSLRGLQQYGILYGNSTGGFSQSTALQYRTNYLRILPAGTDSTCAIILGTVGSVKSNDTQSVEFNMRNNKGLGVIQSTYGTRKAGTYSTTGINYAGLFLQNVTDSNYILDMTGFHGSIVLARHGINKMVIDSGGIHILDSTFMPMLLPGEGTGGMMHVKDLNGKLELRDSIGLAHDLGGLAPSQALFGGSTGRIYQSPNFYTDYAGNMFIGDSSTAQLIQIGKDGMTTYGKQAYAFNRAQNLSSTGYALLSVMNNSGQQLSIVKYGSATSDVTCGLSNANLTVLQNDEGNFLISAALGQGALYFATSDSIRMRITTSGLIKLSDIPVVAVSCDSILVLQDSTIKRMSTSQLSINYGNISGFTANQVLFGGVDGKIKQSSHLYMNDTPSSVVGLRTGISGQEATIGSYSGYSLFTSGSTAHLYLTSSIGYNTYMGAGGRLGDIIIDSATGYVGIKTSNYAFPLSVNGYIVSNSRIMVNNDLTGGVSMKAISIAWASAQAYARFLAYDYGTSSYKNIVFNDDDGVSKFGFGTTSPDSHVTNSGSEHIMGNSLIGGLLRVIGTFFSGKRIESTLYKTYTITESDQILDTIALDTIHTSDIEFGISNSFSHTGAKIYLKNGEENQRLDVSVTNGSDGEGVHIFLIASGTAYELPYSPVSGGQLVGLKIRTRTQGITTTYFKALYMFSGI
jgi:hypothetical protein